MARVKRGNVARKRRKKILKAAKGFRGAPSRLFRIAHNAITKAGKYSYRDRKNRKREFRKLWIVRINIAARQLGIRYNEFISALKKSSIELDRKQIADLVVNDQQSFLSLVEKIGLKPNKNLYIDSK